MEPQANIQNKEKKNNKNRVRVAIRVRPMINKQSTINESSCVQYSPPNHIIIGKDRCFTFDQVFSQKASQLQVYEKCVKELVLGCFEGYNAAVLAYGQTGSGKTYTMGTGASQLLDQQLVGIIPRVIQQIFRQIQVKKNQCTIIVRISFIQIYNEQIIDLLAANPIQSDPFKNNKSSISKDFNGPTIRQQKDGSISLVNVVEETVSTCEQMLGLLQRGGRNRSTSSTLMNDCSSRSHGIFSIHLQQHQILNGQQEQGFITAKFYFVDLAGSERAKKTGASGLTLKEGININLGLLELGNVISALSISDKKQSQFITYRNSKLTRILQDSLGGNSNTYMISCISPAESNYQQSLNTIKYATKAMNIKNKPVVNRDPHSAQVNALKQRIFQLQLENKNLKKALSQSGITIIQQNLSRSDPRTDLLTEQVKKMRQKNVELQKKMEKIEIQLIEKQKKKNELEIQNYDLKRQRDKFRYRCERLNEMQMAEYNQNEEEIGLIEQYQRKISHLQNEVLEQQKINNRLQQEHQKVNSQIEKYELIIKNKNKQITKLKINLQSMYNSKLQKLNNPFQQNSINLEKSQTFKNQVSMLENNANGSYSEDEINDDIGEQDEDLQMNMEDHEFNEAQADYIANSNAHNQKLKQVETTIREHEEKLQAMTEDQINLEYQLISQMKEQYHQKIMTLQKEKQMIMKQQQEMAGYQKNPKLLQKVEGLQGQLRQLRKKAKEQSNLQKLVSNQNEQLKKLSNEIKLQKVYKIEINRKIKEDKLAFDQFKKQKIKQIISAKKDNVKKDKEIRKLALENRKKSLQMKKKNDQLHKIRKVNIAMKNFKQNNKKRHNRNFINLSLHQKNISPNNSLKNDNFIEDEASEHLVQLHRGSLQLVIIQEEIKVEMEKYERQINELDNEIERLSQQEANTQMKLDKLEINYQFQKNSHVQVKTNEQLNLIANLSQLKQRIVSIQQNIIFCQQRYQELEVKLPKFYEEADIINNQNVNTLEKMQFILKLTYQSLRTFVSNGIIHYKNSEMFKAERNQLFDQLQKSRDQLSKVIVEHQMNLARLRQEMMTKYYNNLEQQHYELNNSMQHFTNVKNNLGLMVSNNQKIDQKERKNYEKKIIDLTKTNRQLSADVEMWRRKCSVVQEKYHNINIKMAKDKFIGRPRQQDPVLKKNSSGWNIGGLNSVNIINSTSHMLEEVNGLIQKFDNKKKVPEEEGNYQNMRNSQEGQFTKNKWDCVMTLKASRSPILSMATKQNLLITSGTKSINIWDQQTCQLVADLSNPNYLQGFVKSVINIPNTSFISAACQKQVFIWDIRTYQSTAVLKGHKEQVRCLHSYGNYLITAGKGGQSNGSLLFWDLRMLDNQFPVDEKQRNFDVFALATNENTLFYGTRNHQVRRLCLENRDVLTPFQPPHMDTVTSLSLFSNYLISGSKDKNLRLWSLDSPNNNIRCTTHAFNDYVNTVESDKNLPIFYAGSRDGQVKIATVSDEKIKFVGGIIAHTQGISTICSIGDSSNGIFLTGSVDKTVKFWKPDQSTVERIAVFSPNEEY